MSVATISLLAQLDVRLVELLVLVFKPLALEPLAAGRKASRPRANWLAFYTVYVSETRYKALFECV